MSTTGFQTLPSPVTEHTTSGLPHVSTIRTLTPATIDAPSSGLSESGRVAIAVAVPIGAFLIATQTWLYWRKQRRMIKAEQSLEAGALATTNNAHDAPMVVACEVYSGSYSKPELDANTAMLSPPNMLAASQNQNVVAYELSVDHISPLLRPPDFGDHFGAEVGFVADTFVQLLDRVAELKARRATILSGSAWSRLED